MSSRSLCEWVVCVRSVTLRQGLNFLSGHEKERRNIYRRGRMRENKERINISEDEWQIELTPSGDWQTEGFGTKDGQKEREDGEQDSRVKKRGVWRRACCGGLIPHPYSHTLLISNHVHTHTHGANLQRPIYRCSKRCTKAPGHPLYHTQVYTRTQTHLHMCVKHIHTFVVTPLWGQHTDLHR